MSIASEVSYSESSTFWPLPVRWRALSAARMELLASIPVQTSTIATPYLVGPPSGSPQMLMSPDSACRMKS